MDDPLQQDLISSDPLSEVTRKERRALLGVSILGLALVLIPLVPTKISAFGIEFQYIERRNFALLYALVIIYYLIAFVVYGFADLVAWRRSETIRYHAYQRAEQANKPEQSPIAKRLEAYSIPKTEVKPTPQPFALGGPTYRGLAGWTTAQVASKLRAIFDFMLPIIFAAVSIYHV